MNIYSMPTQALALLSALHMGISLALLLLEVLSSLTRYNLSMGLSSSTAGIALINLSGAMLFDQLSTMACFHLLDVVLILFPAVVGGKLLMYGYEASQRATLRTKVRKGWPRSSG